MKNPILHLRIIMPLARARDATRKREMRLKQRQGRVQPPTNDDSSNPTTDDSSNPLTVATLPERKRLLTAIIRSKLPTNIQARDMISAQAELNRLEGSYPVEKVPGTLNLIITYIERPPAMSVSGFEVPTALPETARGLESHPGDSQPQPDTVEGELVEVIETKEDTELTEPTEVIEPTELAETTEPSGDTAKRTPGKDSYFNYLERELEEEKKE